MLMLYVDEAEMSLQCRARMPVLLGFNISAPVSLITQAHRKQNRSRWSDLFATNKAHLPFTASSRG